MSLMKTLAKVAIGVAVAKGASAMMKGGQPRAQADSSGGLGGLLGGLTGQMQQQPQASRQGGGIEDMLGGLLGGGGTSAAQGGGLGGLLEQLGAGGAGQSQSAAPQGGGLNDLLGGLAGAAGAGGLGGMLGGLLGGAQQQQAQQPQGGFGDLLNQAIARQGEPDVPPAPAQEMAAGLMLRAMIQAAKCDGKFDQNEQSKLLDKLGDVSREEQAFVEAELQAPVDVQGLAGQVPRGMGPQVYAMSVMAIDLDSQAEAQYLHQFAQALGLGPQDVNHIHAQLGVPAIYG